MQATRQSYFRAVPISHRRSGDLPKPHSKSRRSSEKNCCFIQAPKSLATAASRSGSGTRDCRAALARTSLYVLKSAAFRLPVQNRSWYFASWSEDMYSGRATKYFQFRGLYFFRAEPAVPLPEALLQFLHISAHVGMLLPEVGKFR